MNKTKHIVLQFCNNVQIAWNTGQDGLVYRQVTTDPQWKGGEVEEQQWRWEKKGYCLVSEGYFNAVGLIWTVFDCVSLATGQNTEEQFKSCPSIRLVYHLTAAFIVLLSNSQWWCPLPLFNCDTSCVLIVEN